MTVTELIHTLAKINGNLKIRIRAHSTDYPIEAVDAYTETVENVGTWFVLDSMPGDAEPARADELEE